MSVSKAKKWKRLKEFHSFHEQTRACGGLMDLHIVQRSELATWIFESVDNEKARTIVRAVVDLLPRWDQEGVGMMCLCCDNKVDQLKDVEAFGLPASHDGGGASGGDEHAMTFPLCRACAPRPDLEALVLAAFKRLAWPDMRVAPPIHAQGGHA